MPTKSNLKKLVKMKNKLSLEERWNLYTHSFGSIISLIGVIYFIIFLNTTTYKATFGFLVYWFSLFFLFTTSSIYHAQTGNKKKKWQKIDHIGIYYLIAGSYTPVCLTILYDTTGILILVIIWLLAIIGTIYKLILINKFENFSLFLYLSMGWLVLFDFKNVYSLLSKELLIYLILGGFFYSFGTIFYKLEKLNFNHVIWHIFVLLGSISHFVFIIKIVGSN